MARYHFRDVEDQRDERAHEVRRGEYRGEPGDFDRRPPLDELPEYAGGDRWAPRPQPGRIPTS